MKKFFEKSIIPTSWKPSAVIKMSACASALLSSILMLQPLAVTNAKAGDVGTVSNASTADSGRFLRVGKGKSMVVHLPAEAKDVVIGNTELVDVMIRTKNVAYIFAKNFGQTNVFFFDANGQQIMNLDLEVAQDPTALRNLIKRTLPGTQIRVDVESGNIVLTGTAMNPLEAKTAYDLATNMNSEGGAGTKVVNAMTIAGEDQVMLQVKVVEIQRDVLKQFGINFKALLDVGGFAFNLSTVNPFSSNAISDANGFGASGVSGTSNFSGVVRAMESDGLLRTLAEPNLTAVSGQPATFLAGGQYPYQICDNVGGVRTCTVSFKDYGVGLNFTPVVLSQGRINLKIHTEVSELNNVTTGLTNAPSLNTRKADTTLEMPDGGSMMLAGLIRETTRQTINGTPGLKSLPVLGALFRSRDFINNQTELVVIVTPHIVRSVAQKQLETPDKNFLPATDRQTILMGRLNKVYGSAGKAPQGTYQGNVGYIVE
ncbi:MAG: type II and III secretion system protein family protein [Alphaproteobacteria bacterium]|nr:type II and III secretion system protein family protein [Alphaproteobacteria bacterium]